MRPEPAPFTADEYSDEQLHDAAASLGLVATVRRWLAYVGTAAILLTAAGVFGYCEGRKSIQPAPGEETVLAKANEQLQHEADSLRKVIDWSNAQRVLLEQKISTAPKVDVIGPRKVRIVPPSTSKVAQDGRIVSPDPDIVPRVVEIDPAITQALVNERQLNAAFRVELEDVYALARVQSARADSALKAAILARARADSKLEKVAKIGGALLAGFFIGRGSK